MKNGSACDQVVLLETLSAGRGGEGRSRIFLWGRAGCTSKPIVVFAKSRVSLQEWGKCAPLQPFPRSVPALSFIITYLICSIYANKLEVRATAVRAGL